MVLTGTIKNLLVWSKNDALKEPKQNQRLGKFLRMNEKERKEWIFSEAEALTGEKKHRKWLLRVSFYLHLYCQLMWKRGFKRPSINRGSNTKRLGVALRSILIQLSLEDVHDAKQ